MSQRNKIIVKGIIVELDGDEMTRVMWQMIKDKLLAPYLELNCEYYDLGLPHRDKTNDEVTVLAARAIARHGVGVKCATITPNEDRVREYGLKEQWKSPNATIRAELDGTVFRKPIMVKNILPLVTAWKKPITIGRHAYGDVYSNVELAADRPGRAELVFTARTGETRRITIKEFDSPGIVQGIHNTDQSITNFAKACFTLAYAEKTHLWFSTKDTISKTYDRRFRDIFDLEFRSNWRDKFAQAGLDYFFTLIDDAAARIVRNPGGILWALKNYDGDVMSDLVASAFGSLAMMTSILVSPEGHFEYEAAHGTIQRHYYKYLKGEETSSNPMALIFTWSGGLRKRGEFDNSPEVMAFADKLEEASREVVEAGMMTGDLLSLALPHPANRRLSTEQFIDAVGERLGAKL